MARYLGARVCFVNVEKEECDILARSVGVVLVRDSGTWLENEEHEIFFALSVPVDIPDKTVLFSFYFEANYPLPNEWNSTYLGVEYLKKRSLDRRLVYSVLESKLESAGFPGEACLLKTICEAADYPFARNGLLGDVLQIVFRPSSSTDENFPARISEAEKAGNCEEKYAECSVSLLDIISRYPTEIGF